MSYGLHWEWRGFGAVDPDELGQIQRLPPIGGATTVTDRYVWYPGLAINLKVREWTGGESLKLKRLLRRDEVLDVELWDEREEEDFPLPLTPEDFRSVLTALSWGHLPAVPPADREALEDLLVHASPGGRLISVTKRRRIYAAALGQVPVRVEVTEIAAPEAVTSVGIEDQLGLRGDSSRESLARGRDAVSAVRDELALDLESRSYLDALGFWARGARLVPET